jgi:hypothetical protein
MPLFLKLFIVHSSLLILQVSIDVFRYMILDIRHHEADDVRFDRTQAVLGVMDDTTLGAAGLDDERDPVAQWRKEPGVRDRYDWRAVEDDIIIFFLNVRDKFPDLLGTDQLGRVRRPGAARQNMEIIDTDAH